MHANANGYGVRVCVYVLVALSVYELLRIRIAQICDVIVSHARLPANLLMNSGRSFARPLPHLKSRVYFDLFSTGDPLLMPPEQFVLKYLLHQGRTSSRPGYNQNGRGEQKGRSGASRLPS